MTRKKIIIGIAVVLLVAIVCCVHLIRENYRLGLEFYNAVNYTSVESVRIADGIAYMQMQFEKPDLDYDTLGSSRHAFDQAIVSTQWLDGFAYDNRTFTEEVCNQYNARFVQLYHLVCNDLDNARLIELFTDPEKAQQMEELEEKLNIMTQWCVDFRERYNQMSDWERCFHSWEEERQILSEKVRFP